MCYVSMYVRLCKLMVLSVCTSESTNIGYSTNTSVSTICTLDDFGAVRAGGNHLRYLVYVTGCIV